MNMMLWIRASALGLAVGLSCSATGGADSAREVSPNHATTVRVPGYFGFHSVVFSQQHPDEAMSGEGQASDEDAPTDEEDAEDVATPRTPEQKLWDEFASLLEELHELRAALADAELRAKDAEREARELRQFIEDREEYGQAYEEFQAMIALREQEIRHQRLQEVRQRYEADRAERLRRMADARAEREQRRAERRERREFEDAGFSHLGLNVYLGQMAYTYRKRDVLQTRVRYSPVIGRFLRPEFRDEVDFTEMIVSGSVVNASDSVRNLGVAITFFDERGNQVGNEIVQVNNARPGVPYPFTSTLRMALDRPFTSTSSYVLYADSAGQHQPAWLE